MLLRLHSLTNGYSVVELWEMYNRLTLSSHFPNLENQFNKLDLKEQHYLISKQIQPKLLRIFQFYIHSQPYHQFEA